MRTVQNDRRYVAQQTSRRSVPAVPSQSSKHETGQHRSDHRADDVRGLQPADPPAERLARSVCTASCRYPKLRPIINVGRPSSATGTTTYSITNNVEA